MFDANVVTPTDAEMRQIEKWRREFAAADLEVPEGYVGDGIATAVAINKEGGLIGSLTASITLAVSLDPLIRNPHAGRLETLAGLFALTKALEYQAQLNGAVASYIAVPNELKEYQELVTRFGFRQTAEHCQLYRHSFRPPKPSRMSQ